MIPPQQFPVLSRRQMLARMGGGFGMLGLSGALNNAGMLSASEIPVGSPHFAPKAKRVIFLMMNGGAVPCGHLRPEARSRQTRGRDA